MSKDETAQLPVVTHAVALRYFGTMIGRSGLFDNEFHSVYRDVAGGELRRGRQYFGTV
jgi:hypothetical protein